MLQGHELKLFHWKKFLSFFIFSLFYVLIKLVSSGDALDGTLLAEYQG